VISATPRAAGVSGKPLVQAAEFEGVQREDEGEEHQDDADREHVLNLLES
jgi:hypothetical protein